LASDTYFHLYCAAAIREHSFRLPDRLPRIILPHRYSYPFLYHYLLACLPMKFRLWAERLTGAFFDTLSLVFIYVFSEWGVLQMGDIRLRSLPIVVAALFAFSPALMRIYSGPRAYNGSPRTVGQTLYLLHILSAYYALKTNSLIGLAISLSVGASLVVTAKFGNQVLVFFGAFFVVWVSYQYALLLLGCFLLALLFTKGHAWSVVKGQVKHSIFYFKNLQRVFLFPYTGSFGSWVQRGSEELGRLIRTGNLEAFLRWFYGERYYLHLLLTVYPQFLLLFYLFIPGVLSDPLEQFLLIWMAAGFIWFVFTKTRPLLFLGEGERYLEFALFPSLFLSARYLIGTWEIVLYVFLGYSLFSSLYSLRQYHESFAPLDRDFERKKALYGNLNQQKPGLIFPLGSFHWQVLYHAQFPVLTYGGNMDESLLSKDEFLLVYGQYPYPSGDFRRIVDRYNVSYIVSDHAHLKHYRTNIVERPEEFDQRVEVIGEIPSLVIGRILSKNESGKQSTTLMETATYKGPFSKRGGPLRT
jgi:hypothetical protein